MKGYEKRKTEAADATEPRRSAAAIRTMAINNRLFLKENYGFMDF